jgi:hypothetical protein
MPRKAPQLAKLTRPRLHNAVARRLVSRRPFAGRLGLVSGTPVRGNSRMRPRSVLLPIAVTNRVAHRSKTHFRGPGPATAFG